MTPVRTADLSLTPIYATRHAYFGRQAGMVIEPRRWFVRDPGGRAVQLGGYLYVAEDRDVEGYTRPRGHVPASGIPMLIYSHAAIDTNAAAGLITATEALRAVWRDPITAGDIRRAVEGAVGRDAGRFLWVEMLRPNNIPGLHERAEDVRPPAPTVNLES